MKWNLCSEVKPEKQGFYLVAYLPPEPGTEAMIDVAEFFRTGDTITYFEPEHDETLIAYRDGLKRLGIIVRDHDQTEENIANLPAGVRELARWVLTQLLTDAFESDSCVAMKDGFYEYTDDWCHELRPSLWADLPEPPEGYHWPEGGWEDEN